MSHSRLRMVLLIGLVLLGATGTRAAVPPPPTVTVSYEVTGDGPVELRYADAHGTLAAPIVVALPWRTQFTVADGVRFLTMSAARTVSGAGDLTCRITADGELVALDGLGGYAQCTGVVTGR
ncbi:hypothetical protein JRC04_21070 [Mycolicibacterium sp. S2-37]|uniref:hypothetical protein n=1 Tax=Mycolicibacterium sp. S2-37 TaxID=2810297 RepID=UPI001A943DD5|nr:hypothetical protein [Mycolicibacterium sp. S2-37]MBO0679969.1 hypothetical protein [Mycolicibacterium sp. S2-37]